MLSFGDLILAVGLCDVAFHASRRHKPRRTITIDLADYDPDAEAQARLQADAQLVSATSFPATTKG